jgi:dihydrodiol dehydrogenase / D-xylose 1-dehydrogenase (NADP)
VTTQLALVSVVALAMSHSVAGKRPRTEPIRWGIMGSGLISSDFVGALQDLPTEEGRVVAVAARSKESADQFAATFDIPQAYEGYEALANDPNVDVIYIGTVAQTHAACVRIALAAGKPVLVEKPIAMCAEEAAALTEEAKSKGLFLLEGMWTRFFPAIRKARELLSSGVLGDVVAVSADFGWPADPEGEHKRCIDPLSGGVSMDVAMYPIAHILLAAGDAPPAKITAVGTTKAAADGRSRVDWSVAGGLSGFPGNPALSATILCTLDGSTPEEAVFTGTKGTLRVHRPAHTPTKLTLSVAESREVSREESFEFPLPPPPKRARPFNYPGSQGFVYEAQAVHTALREGRLQCAEWTHREAVTTLACVDALRSTVVAGDA